jgi:hypothetical protein
MVSSTAADLGSARKASPPASPGLVVSFFEWFGELGIFCSQLVPATFLPPYEVRAQLPSQPSDKEFAYDAKEIFDKSDNAKLKNEKVLDAAGKFLEQNKFRLAVVATSAEVGDAKKDRVLTQARAKVVRDFLVQNFKFDDTKLKTIGLGKSTGAGETGKVEIRVYD